MHLMCACSMLPSASLLPTSSLDFDSAIDLDTITYDSAIAFDIDYDSAIAYSNCTSPFRGESPYYVVSLLLCKQASAACEPHLQHTPRHSHHLLHQ